jgi:hypothetical protein
MSEIEEIKELKRLVTILEYRVEQLEKRIDVKFDLNELLRDMQKESKETIEKLSKLPMPKPKDIDLHQIKTVEEIKAYIYSIGDIPRGKYFDRMASFILTKRGNTFSADDLDKQAGFKKNRKSRRDYCIKFISWNLIKETKTQGIYKVIF